MQKAVGIVLIILSVLLFVKGYDVAHSLASQVKQAVAGVPVEAAGKFYLAGFVAGLLGLLLIFWKGK
jgi:uncharacterized membrane protein